MFSMLASSGVRPVPSLHLLSSRVGMEQVRNVTKKAAGQNRQVLASKTTKNQKGFRMKKKVEPKATEKHDGIYYMQPMPVARLKAEILNGPRAELNLPAFLPEEATPRLSSGKARAFSEAMNNIMRAYGLPRNVLIDFRVLSQPSSVIRDVTLRLIDRIESASQSSSSGSRMVLTGSAGSGKSYLMLQAVAYAQAIGHIVLYIPRASKLVDSSTPYVYDPRTRTYAQPKYAHQLLGRILSVNAAQLQTLRLGGALLAEDASTRLSQGSPLSDLVTLGVREPSNAPAILSTLFAELAKQSQFPVLLAIDDFQSLYQHTSWYRNPKYQCIKPYHLSTPRLLLEYASNQKSFARGSVIGAVSRSNTNWPVSLELLEALRLTPPRPVSEYAKRYPELSSYAVGLENFAVPDQLSLDEAASMYELWHQDKALHTHSNDEFFLSKYTEACGNARKFVWEGLLRTMST